MSVFHRRVLWAVAVQGEKAAGEVAAAIRGFNAIAADGAVPRPDLLIVARGGGCIEDLMAFNEEIVVRAAAESAIPLISAVGHETDTTLIDFASDRRAPTPTRRRRNRLCRYATNFVSQTLDFQRRVFNCFTRGISTRRTQLSVSSPACHAAPRRSTLRATAPAFRCGLRQAPQHALRRNLQEHRRAFTEISALLRPKPIGQHIKVCGERTQVLGRRLQRSFTARLKEDRKRLEATARVLDSVSYRGVLERGFVLVRGADGHVRRRAEAVASGEALTLTFADGAREAIADGVPDSSKAAAKPRPAKPKAGQGTLF